MQRCPYCGQMIQTFVIQCPYWQQMLPVGGANNWMSPTGAGYNAQHQFPIFLYDQPGATRNDDDNGPGWLVIVIGFMLLGGVVAWLLVKLGKLILGIKTPGTSKLAVFLVWLALMGGTYFALDANGMHNHRSNQAQTTQTVPLRSQQLGWNQGKARALQQAMNQWAPSMGQYYYWLSAGQFKFTNHQDVADDPSHTIGWSNDGSYDYEVVAVANFNRSFQMGAIEPGHITYAFAFYQGHPIVLVSQDAPLNQMNWQLTQNQTVANLWHQIATQSSTTE